MRRFCAILLAVVLIVSGCTATRDDKERERTSVSPLSTQAPAEEGEQVQAVVDGVTVRATASVADKGRRLSISEMTADLAESPARVGATKVMSVQLDGGEAQPAEPVRVEFDLSGRPDLVALMTDDVVPVVETVSEEATDEFDMFRAHWDPKTRKISANVTHLTGIGVAFMDVAKAVRDGAIRVFEAARGTTRSPCRDSSKLTVGDVTYTLTAMSPGAVAGCLVADDGAVAVDFENATGAFYAVGVAPNSAGGSWTGHGVLDMSDSAGSLFSAVPNSRGVLVGRGSGRLTMEKGIDKFDVRLAPQQQGILAKSLMSGISMLGVDLGRLKSVPEAWDCIATSIDATQIDESFSPGALYSMITSVAQCAITNADVANMDDGKARELHRLGVAVELFSLAQQLKDLTAVVVQQVAQDSVKDFRIRSSGRPSTSSVPSPGSSAATAEAADRIEIKTWAYDKIAENTYVADNLGRKSNVYIHVNSFAGGKEVRSGCRTAVVVSGPGVSFAKSEAGCYIGDPGITFDAPSVGQYTVAVTVSQGGTRDITSRVIVNIVAK